MAANDPTDLIPGALLALSGQRPMEQYSREIRTIVGEDDFEILETGLAFADLGLADEAARLLSAVCIDGVAESDVNPLPLYFLAYYASLGGDDQAARSYLERAAGISRDFVFASRPEAIDVLLYAIDKNPSDANAHLHLGNLFGNLGRLDEAVSHWQIAAELNQSLSMAFRNLALHRATVNDLPGAAKLYRKAIAARPKDQTLYRDLAEITIADGKRPEAITILETMPFENTRRTDIIIMLAQAYFDERQYTKVIELLESTPYFVNWEGQDITWMLFNKAHVARGRQRFDNKEFSAALADFEAGLTYPENLGVGRSDKPEEAAAQFWRGKTLKALGRLEEARTAWQTGADLPEGSNVQNTHRRQCLDMLQSNAAASPKP